ncbi:MAG TPA: hypothetical protein VM600_01695, partial [Actinomycetota bacterium]|nr:hypothetical protein [Actinomycetota bacterium]
MRPAIAVLVVALLGGCAGRPPQAADFVKHANVICADMKRNIIAASHSDDYAELTLQVVERGIKAMRSLPVPDELK